VDSAFKENTNKGILTDDLIITMSACIYDLSLLYDPASLETGHLPRLPARRVAHFHGN
jgi:hypothetical protein